MTDTGHSRGHVGPVGLAPGAPRLLAAGTAWAGVGLPTPLLVGSGGRRSVEAGVGPGHPRHCHGEAVS